jgi:hypothetical protein
VTEAPYTGASSAGLHHAVYTGLTTGVHSGHRVIAIAYAGFYPGCCFDTYLYTAVGWGRRHTVPGLSSNTGQECIDVASAFDIRACSVCTFGASAHLGCCHVPPHGD